MAKQDDYARYTIRIPTALYEQLKESAGDKSVNAEIIARLEASFRAGPKSSDVQADLVSAVDRLRAMIENATMTMTTPNGKATIRRRTKEEMENEESFWDDDKPKKPK